MAIQFGADPSDEDLQFRNQSGTLALGGEGGDLMVPMSSPPSSTSASAAKSGPALQ
jgi:hypothetical protein